MSALPIVASTVNVTSTKFNPLDPIGSILDGALSDVEKSLEAATGKIHDAAADLIRQAGDQAFKVIADLKGAYADSLELTYQKADKLMQENIERVADLAKGIVSGTQEAISKVASQVEDIVRLSPLSKGWVPFLTDTTPHFFAVDAADKQASITNVLITFKGNFPCADRSDCVPIFTMGGTEYRPVSNTTKELQFRLSVSSDSPKLSMRNYSYLSGSLKETWKSGYLPWSWTTSEYRVLLGMLPATPGKIQVVYTKTAQTITQPFSSNEVQIVRDKDHWSSGSFSASAHAGWHVVPGTAKPYWVDGPHGQCNADIKIDPSNPDLVVCNYNRKDGSGRVKIVFNESQVHPKETRLESHDDLRWGSTFIARPGDGEDITQINFDAFNGSRTEFQPRTDESNPFITLRKTDGTIQIAARNAAAINAATLPWTKSAQVIETRGDSKERKETKEPITEARASA